MAHTYTNLLNHFVFSTKNRVPMLEADLKEHNHRKVSFQEELISFLKKHEIEYDERYLWV